MLLNDFFSNRLWVIDRWEEQYRKFILIINQEERPYNNGTIVFFMKSTCRSTYLLFYRKVSSDVKYILPMNILMKHYFIIETKVKYD